MQEQISQSFQNIQLQITSGVIGLLPGLLKGIAILLVGWLLATILSKICYRIIKSTKGDKMTETLNKVDFFKKLGVDVPTFFKKLMFWIILLITGVIASEQLGLSSLTAGISTLIGYIPRLISALLFFVIGVLVANFIKDFIRSAMDSMNLSTSRFISSIIFSFLFILVSFVALEQAGINTSALVQNFQIIIGGLILAVGLGYGLSSRDLFANILGSVYSKGKFQIGQRIRFQQTEGQIVEMDSTSITVQTDKSKIVIPLAKFTTEMVEILS